MQFKPPNSKMAKSQYADTGVLLRCCASIPRTPPFVTEPYSLLQKNRSFASAKLFDSSPVSFQATVLKTNDQRVCREKAKINLQEKREKVGDGLEKESEYDMKIDRGLAWISCSSIVGAPWKIGSEGEFLVRSTEK